LFFSCTWSKMTFFHYGQSFSILSLLSLPNSLFRFPPFPICPIPILNFSDCFALPFHAGRSHGSQVSELSLASRIESSCESQSRHAHVSLQQKHAQRHLSSSNCAQHIIIISHHIIIYSSEKEIAADESQLLTIKQLKTTYKKTRNMGHSPT